MGATALTIPYFASQGNSITTSAQAAEQASVPTQGFADLVEKVQPAVVSVQVKNGTHQTSSTQPQHQRNSPGDMLERFFERHGGQFKRQSFNDNQQDNPGYQWSPQNQEQANQEQTNQYQGGKNHNCDNQNHADNGGGYNDNAQRQRSNDNAQGRRYGGYMPGPRYGGNMQGGQFDNATPNQQFQGIRERQRQRRQQPEHQRSSQGSGFIISPDGYVVTNYHVVEGGETIELKMSDGKIYEAKVVGSDEKTDLALLKIDADREFEYVTFADTAGRVGDWVIAVGNPFGLGGTVTTGIISAKGRDLGAGPYDDYIQIDAPINQGNSGGPAFNLNGQVVGVNTAIYSPSGGNVGIGFAIPASVAKEVIEDLKDDGTVSRGWLGVQIQTLTADIAESLGLDQTKGAIVAMVQNGSPAEKAGFKVGDLVLQVSGDEVEDPKDLARKVADIAPGSEIEFTVYRDGETITHKVTLGTLGKNDQKAEIPEEKPTANASLGSLGLVLTTEDGGVVISSVSADGPAAAKGLKAGDRILEIGGEKVSSGQQVEDRIAAMKADGRKAVLMLVRSGDSQRFVAVELNRG
jgi:serine protease Do